jgi:biopolymer transport protein TolR
MQTGGQGGDSGGGAAHAGATYQGLRSRRTTTVMGEINVTPLVDVVLVLLLVFMVTAPLMSRGIDVKLPVANQPQIAEVDRVTVSIDAEGRVYVADKAVNMLLLEDRVREFVEGQGIKIFYLRADERLRYGKVIEVVDKLKRAGVEQIGFVYTLPPPEKAPS